MKILLLLSTISLCFAQSGLSYQKSCRSIYKTALLKKEFAALGTLGAGVGLASYKNNMSSKGSRESSLIFSATVATTLGVFFIDFKRKSKVLDLIDNAYDYEDGAEDGIETLVQVQEALSKEGIETSLAELAEQITTKNEDLSLCSGKVLRFGKIINTVETVLQ